MFNGPEIKIAQDSPPAVLGKGIQPNYQSSERVEETFDIFTHAKTKNTKKKIKKTFASSLPLSGSH